VVEVGGGYEKGQRVEKVRTRVVGLEGLTSYDQYGPGGWSKSKNKKDFRVNEINAVVV